MPFTAPQLASVANYALAQYERKEPIDQINFKHVLLDWLIKNKKPASFTGGSFKEPIYYTNDSNAQNYFGADQVTYNERDPARWTDFPWYNLHDGFWFDEDRLLAAGINMTDDNAQAMPTASEKEVLIDLLKQSYRALRNSMQQHLAFEFYLDGSQSAKAAPGLETLVDWTPATGTVGGINAANDTWWQNNADIGIATPATNLIPAMEDMYQDIVRYGGTLPNFIVGGQGIVNAYRDAANEVVNRFTSNGGNLRGGVSIDAATNNLYFHNTPVLWDPTLDEIDATLGTTTRTDTMYFLNSDHISLRPVKGRWMLDRKPERLPDRYVHYFAKTSSYGLTVNKRNALGVIQLA